MDFLEDKGMKPHKGNWVGFYVPLRGASIPDSIHIMDVNDNGTLEGTLVLDPDWARSRGIQLTPFRSAVYSTFGSLHISQEVVLQHTADEVEFIGNFHMATDKTGSLVGTVILRRKKADGTSAVFQTGTLTAGYGAGTMVTIGSSPWDDGTS
jgi:hypothetical protein